MKAFFCCLGLAWVLACATGAQANHRFWARCNYEAPTFTTSMTRDAAQDYANEDFGFEV